MNLTFSAHALDRCFERGISLQLIADALFSGRLERYGDRYVVVHGPVSYTHLTLPTN